MCYEIPITIFDGNPIFMHFVTQSIHKNPKKHEVFLPVTGNPLSNKGFSTYIKVINVHGPVLIKKIGQIFILTKYQNIVLQMDYLHRDAKLFSEYRPSVSIKCGRLWV